MKNAAFINLLFEDQWLWEASSASEEAKKHNLKHVGGGAWANDQGEIVAKTNRKTKSLDWLNGSPEGGDASAPTAPGDSSSPQSTAPLTIDVDTAKVATNKLTNLMLALMGADEDPTLAQHKSAIRDAIVTTIIGGKVELPKNTTLTDEQLAELQDGLDAYVLNPKNKLANQIKAYADSKIGKPEEPAPEVPQDAAPKKKTPFTPKKTSGTGEYDVFGAMKALGLDPSKHEPDPDSALEKLLALAAEAKNQNKLNYIGAKLIKAGLIDKQQWKAFRKYHRNAFGVLPAGKNGDDAPDAAPTDAPQDTPEEPVEEPYEPQAPALEHPEYAESAKLLNAAGIDINLHLATPEQMDAISTALISLYDVNNTEDLKDAVKNVPFLSNGDQELLYNHFVDTYKSIQNNSPEAPVPEEEPVDEPTQGEPVQAPTEHPDYGTVSFWMDKAGAFDTLQSLSYDDITGIYADLSAATQATTNGERFDAIMNLVDSGLLSYENSVALQDAIEAAHPQVSGDPKAARVKQDVEPDVNHPVWGVPMDMVSIVDKAVEALGPWADNDVQFLPKLEKQALANAIVNGYQSGSPNEVDNQFDEVDSKVALAGYQLADIAQMVKELIAYGPQDNEPQVAPDAPVEEPAPEETPSAQFTPKEEEFVSTFNELPDTVRLATGKFVGDAMKKGIFKEPSQDTGFPMLLATVGKILNGDNAFENIQALYDAKLVNPIYSPALLMKTINDEKASLGGSDAPVEEPAPSLEPQEEPTGDVAPSAAQVAVDGYEFTNAKMVKAVDTSMNGWGGGDSDKVMNWVLKKFNASYEPAWKDAAMALVKNFGYDINKVPPELLPVDIKQAMENPAPAQPAAPSIGDSEVDASPDDYVYNNPPEPTPEPAAPEEEPQAPEPEAPEPETIAPKDALGIASGYFSNYGVDIDKLDGPQKVKVVDSIQQALKADTDFGVMYAMQQLKKAGFLKADLVDGLGIDLLEKLESEGKISDDPDAYKKYLTPEHFTDIFFAQNASFAASLSDEQKKHINAVVRQGLNLKDDPGAIKGSTVYPMTGYQKSKQLYKTELADKIPGFTEDIFQKFRNGAMQYHDEVKNLTKFSNEKKAAIKQAKEEAIQLQKALEELGSGDSASAISSIADVSGVTDPTMKQKVMVTIAQALQAPTSQLMIDKLNTLSHTNSYSGGNLDDAPSGMTAQAFKTLRSLVAATYFDQNGEDKKISYPEPKVNEPPTVRAQHVFDNWTEKFGMTLGHMPKNTSYYNAVGERQAVRDAVVQALQEPDQKKVNSILNSLFVTASSLTDKQINQLRQLVHDERKSPSSLDPNKKSTTPQKYKAAAAPTTNSTGGALPDKDISNDPEYKKKSVYYKLPDQKKKEVHDAIFSALGSQISTWNKASKTNSLQYQLQNLGMDSASARKVALWAVRENMQNGALAQKAKNIQSVHNNAAGTSSYGSKPLPTPGDEAAAKQFVANIDPSQDKHELASVEYVKGEKVMVNSSLQWTGKTNTKNNDYQQDLSAQKAWRAKNRSPEDLQKFQDGMSSWLGSGQWSKPAQQRKALNEIMTRMVEGPPPQYSQVNTHVERGMSMSPEDFKDYIKAFKVGEPVYIGPSGFSANTSTAHEFGAKPNNQNPDYVKVLMRVKPDKTGKIKMVRLDPFGSEQECVVGTNRQTRCTNVIKHVTYTGGQAMIAYEIELEYDESITEGKLLGESVGVNMNYWKGLSKETIKAMIKYNNSSVHTKWEK